MRPLVDNLYFLKEISPLLSPAYWVGLLTPLLCLNVIFRYKANEPSSLDRYFAIWASTLCLGTLLIFCFDPTSLLSVEYMIKLLLPVYLYPMLRRLIRNEKDMVQLVYTFLLSCIPVGLILMFEVVINPIRLEESRGLERIQGNFGDVVSYGLYIAFGFASIAFLKLRSSFDHWKHYLPFAIILVVCLVGLFNIHHVASYIVFFTILGLFLIFFVGHKRESGLIIATVILALLVFTLGDFVDERISPIVAKDMAVYNGELDQGQLFHGRFGRWSRMWDEFGSKSILSQFMGYPINFDYAYHFVGMGAHNDYMRLLFLSGYVGLGAYLLLLFQVWGRIRKQSNEFRFIAYACLAALMLYSISVTPTFYAPFMYFVLVVFAYLALPVKSSESNA